MLSVKLPRLPGWLEARRAHARAYDEGLSGVPGLVLPPRVPGTESSVSAYTVRVGGGRRDALARHLRDAGVESAVYYPKPLHLQQAMSAFELAPRALPVAEAASTDVLSLPVYPELTPSDRAHVTRSVREFFATQVTERRAFAGGA